MFNVTGGEVVIIILAALVILGPEKLPDVVRRAGRLYGELRRMSDGFQSELRSALDEPTRELRETAEMAKSSFTGVVDTVKTAVNPGAAIQGKVLDAVKGNGSKGDEPASPAAAPATEATADAASETPVELAPGPATAPAPSWSPPTAEAIGTAALPPPSPALASPPAAFPAPALSPPGPGLPPPSAHEGA